MGGQSRDGPESHRLRLDEPPAWNLRIQNQAGKVRTSKPTT